MMVRAGGSGRASVQASILYPAPLCTARTRRPDSVGGKVLADFQEFRNRCGMPLALYVRGRSDTHVHGCIGGAAVLARCSLLARVGGRRFSSHQHLYRLQARIWTRVCVQGEGGARHVP